MEQQSTSSNGTANQFNVQEIFEMMERTKAQIILSENRNLILLIGITGSGKSTLAHFLVKDNTKLKSVRKSAGQYLLEDEERKISQQTTTSQTIIPQLVEDINNTYITLYDCPGFHDTRNTATDIVNAYSMHKIIEHANNLKIIFVISYHSVEFSRADRHSFTELMENASKFIKNIDNYEQSIAAVVTKVDNIREERENGNYELISDNEVLSGIADFLRQIQLEIREDESYYSTAFNLINIFLRRNCENYERLAIFRRPEKAGLVSANHILQDEKLIIQNMLRRNINFSRKREIDFGYTISEESRNNIFYLVEELNRNIRNTMILIINEVIENYKNLENEDVDLNKKIEQFRRAHLEFLVLEERLQGNVNLSEIVEGIIEILNGFNIEVPKNHFDILLKQKDNLKFLSTVAERTFHPNSTELINGIEPLLKYLNDSKEWLIFLSSLYAKLTEYDIQKDTSRFNINELQILYNSWIQQNVERNGSDFRSLFEQIYTTEIGYGQFIINYYSIEYVKVDEIKLRMLLNILIYTLENDININTIDPTKILITGKFIKLSKILHEILPPHIKNIDIFAANKIYIDENINFVGEKRKLFIAAPEWKIINTRIINLNGVNALQHTHNRANDGTIQNSKGDDGIPGLSGGAAGTIFGIGRYFSNLNSLTITANGGDGSDGQNGGNGLIGENGLDPKLPTDGYYLFAIPQIEANNGIRVIRIAKNIHVAEDLADTFHPGLCDKFQVFGSHGKPGGHGGDGGYYGKGGAKGKINIIDLSYEPRRMDYNSDDGNNGNEGIGGNGGSGGTNGKQIIVKNTAFAGFAKWVILDEFNEGTQPSGLNGSNNINEIGYENPENSIQIENIHYIIIAYKRYLDGNLNNSINRNMLSEFIQKLNENVIFNIIT